MVMPYLVKAQSISPSLNNQTLINQLRTDYYPTSIISYDRARDSMYAKIDNISDSIACVYTGYKISYLASEGDPSTVAFNKDINAEHTWPQSFYNSASPMVSDLHQLFPTWDIANSTRNNHPFAEIDDNNTTKWMYNATSTTSKPASNVIDLYSEFYNSTFEPREDHKGNVARAMFYFWTMYQNQTAITDDETNNEAWFNGMKSMLYDWHRADPVDQREIDRSTLIANIQGKENPFVLDSSLIYRAYFYTENTDTSGLYDNQIIISQYYEGASNNKWIEIANVGQLEFNFSNQSIYVHLFSNPSSELSGVSPNNSYQLTGTLGAGSTILLKNSNAVTPTHGTGTASSVCNFNGNDVIILSKATGTDAWENRTDVFGLYDGSTFASNQFFVRKQSVVKGVQTWDQNEWTSDSYQNLSNSEANNSINYLGYHTSNEVIVLNGSEGWRFLSFPVSTKSLSTILEPIWTQGISGGDTESGSSNVYTYHEATNNFISASNITANNSRGIGYGIYVYADDDNNNSADTFPKILSFEEEADSEFSFSLNKSNQGWNLIGNPYNSAIDWDHNSWTKTNVSNVFYLYDHTNQNYKSWNGLVGTNGMQNGIIPAFQAFFVQVTSNSNTLSLTTSAKSTDIPLYKRTAFEDIRIKGGNNEVVLVFHEAGEINLDRFDAKIPPEITERNLALSYADDFYSILSFPFEYYSNDVLSLETTLSEDQISIENNSSYQIELKSTDWGYNIQLNSNITSLEKDELPNGFELKQNFPNPFNPITTIEFELPARSKIQLEVFNMLGQKIRTISKDEFIAGVHQVRFDGSNLSSGVYIYRLQTEFGTLVKRLTLLK